MKCKNGSIRFTNKNTNESERKTFEGWWSEATNLFGTSVSYFVHPYALSGHDFIYGEDPTALWPAPVGMLALAQLNNDSLMLSKFGIQCDADLTVVIPIKDFAEAMGNNYAAPKAGDLIRLDEVGWDRPGGGGFPNSYPSTQQTGASTTDFCKLDDPESLKTMSNTLVSGISGAWSWDNWMRGPNIYEVTEKRDENIPAQMNPLAAHIVWYIKCKRFDYSYEPYAPREHGSNLVTDNTQYGKISGTPVIEPDKLYNQNAGTEVEKSWDYVNTGGKDSVYGGY
jgi:hypothetical protein